MKKKNKINLTVVFTYIIVFVLQTYRYGLNYIDIIACILCTLMWIGINEYKYKNRVK